MSERELFVAAVHLTDPAARAAFLDQACAADRPLRDRVQSLLVEHDKMGSFLEAPAAAPPADAGTRAFAPESPATGTFAPDASSAVPPADHPGRGEKAGAVVGGKYTLVEAIGEGGMGSVWRARQTEPVKRFVAVKLIKAGMDSKQVVARFEAERQALALMDHPNIAKVLDGGLHHGRPFFVMELVKGVPITEYCDARKLAPRERLELFVPVCQAIQHAHQKGVIHRDIKPSNVLVALYDDKPVVKVIDFGVAKAAGAALTERTIDTGFGGVVGTPEYMSPEQATFNNLDIDTRSDVYALGVLLYELLAGSPPFARRELERRGLLEMLRVVREEEPPRPSTKLSTADALPTLSVNRGTEPRKLTGLLRSELDWVVMKALEKDRARRYETANAFAAEVQRYLSGEAVHAHPPSAAYRLKKFVRRHRGRVVAASLVLIALLGGIAGTTLGLIEARRQEQAARAQEQLAREESAEKEKARGAEAERVTERDHALGLQRQALAREAERSDELKYRLGVSDMVLASAAFDKRDVALVAERLDRVPAGQRGWEWRYLKQTHGGLFTLYGHTGRVCSAAFSPDGTRLVTAAARDDRTAEVIVWDARTGERRFELGGLKPLKMQQVVPVCASFGPDGDRILVAGGEGTPSVWDARTGKLLLELDEPMSTVAAFSPDGSRIVTGALEAPAKVWDARTGALLFDLGGESNSVAGVAFSPDGTRIATYAFRGYKVLAWDARKQGNPLFKVEVNAWVRCVAFSPDGTRIAGGGGNVVKICDARDGKAVGPEIRHRLETTQEWTTEFSGVFAVAFSPDGTRIATVGGEGQRSEARVWDARTGAELLEMTGHQGLVNGVAFSPDGARVVTAGWDGTVKVWDSRVGTSRVEFAGHKCQVNALALSPDGTRVVTGGGATLGVTSGTGRATVWDARTGAPLLELRGLTGTVNDVAFSPDGTRIATGGTRTFASAEVKVWDAGTGALLLELTGFKEGVQSVAFSPDGTRIATGGANDSNYTGTEVKVWDARTGALLLDLTHSYAPLPYPPIISMRGWRVAFSPDGTRLLAVAGGPAAVAKVWDVRTGKVAVELKGLSGFVQSVGFSPDGTRIVTCGEAAATVWDARTGTAVTELKGHTGDVMGAAFSPDGARVVTGSGDRTLRVWDARTGTSLAELNGHVGYVTCVAVSRDGTRLFAGGRGEAGKLGQAMVWDVPTRTAAPALTGHSNHITSAAFSPDSTRVVTGSHDGTVKLWDAHTGRVVFELKGFENGVEGVGFSPDGTRIVLTGHDRTTRVWDAETGKEMPGAPIPSTVPAARVSPDGKLFARMDANHTVQLVTLKPDAAELAFRLLCTEPGVGRYLEGYLAARAAKDDFAVKFYVNLLPEARRTALLAKAEMDALEILAAQHLWVQDWNRGLPLLVELLNLKKTNLGPEHPDTTDVLNQLAGLYRRMRQFDKAVPLFEELLKIREAKLGPEHPDTTDVLNQLAGLYRQMRRFDKAVPLFDKLVKLREAKFGRAHPDTLDSIRNLGLSHRDAGRPRAAIPLLEEVRRAAKEDQSIANELIDAYTQAGEHAKAVTILAHRLAEARKVQPKDEYALVDALARLGTIHLEQKNWAAAEPLLRECWTARERLQPDDWNTFNTQSLLGASLLGQKKYTEAEPLLLAGYEGMKQREKTIPTQGGYVLCIPEALDRLIELYSATDKPHEAKRWRAERAKYPTPKEVAPPPRERR